MPVYALVGPTTRKDSGLANAGATQTYAVNKGAFAASSMTTNESLVARQTGTLLLCASSPPSGGPKRAIP